METEKVVEINKDRIVLSNSDIMLLINQTPIKEAFDKIQNASSVSGKTQYWIYRVWKKIIELHRDIDSVRIKMAMEFCNKEEDGTPIFTDSQYQFDSEKKKLYEEEISRLDTESEGSTIPMNDTVREGIALHFCKRDKNGKPIKIGGNNLSMSEEGGKQFNIAFADLIKEENVLPFDKIKISSELLEKMNGKSSKIIDVTDMIMLEKIFDFTE